jgi:hypothetical protein
MPAEYATHSTWRRTQPEGFKMMNLPKLEATTEAHTRRAKNEPLIECLK